MLKVVLYLSQYRYIDVFAGISMKLYQRIDVLLNRLKYMYHCTRTNPTLISEGCKYKMYLQS